MRRKPEDAYQAGINPLTWVLHFVYRDCDSRDQLMDGLMYFVGVMVNEQSRLESQLFYESAILKS